MENAKVDIEVWIELCNQSGINEFIDASNSIENRLEYIVNSFIDERYTNGITEGKGLIFKWLDKEQILSENIASNFMINDLIDYIDGCNKNNIRKFTNVATSIDGLNNEKNIKSGNDLIYKMSLVCYNLNRSIEMGNQSNFYRYLINVVNEYENNKDKYYNIQGLYKEFLIKCLDRLGYKKMVRQRS